MSFLNHHKTMIALTAAFMLLTGGTFLTGVTGHGSGSTATMFFGIEQAFAGPGCGGASMGASSAANGGNQATASKGCTKPKEECINMLMSEKGMTRKEAEAAYETMHRAGGANAAGADHCAMSGGKASATMAKGMDCSASGMKAGGMKKGCCSSKKSGMGMAKATNGMGAGSMQAAATTSGRTYHTRESCIADAMAKGMTQAEAEAAANRCGKAGFHRAATDDAAAFGTSREAAKKTKVPTTSARASASGSSK